MAQSFSTSVGGGIRESGGKTTTPSNGGGTIGRRNGNGFNRNATFVGPEASKEEFRRYLEQSDLLGVLTKALVTLYEDPDRPENAVDFLRQYLLVGQHSRLDGCDARNTAAGQPPPPPESASASAVDNAIPASSTIAQNPQSISPSNRDNYDDDEDDNDVTKTTILSLQRDNARLQRENDALRAELERLRLNRSGSSISSMDSNSNSKNKEEEESDEHQI